MPFRLYPVVRLGSIGLAMGSVAFRTIEGSSTICLGGGLYYLVFYQARFVPRWLSGWGLAGVVLMATGALLALFHDTEVTGYVPLVLPIGVQEMVFAVWLIVRGCNPSPGRGGT